MLSPTIVGKGFHCDSLTEPYIPSCPLNLLVLRRMLICLLSPGLSAFLMLRKPWYFYHWSPDWQQWTQTYTLKNNYEIYVSKYQMTRCRKGH